MALLNQLVSRKLGGKWILRIEDTDQVGLAANNKSLAFGMSRMTWYHIRNVLFKVRSKISKGVSAGLALSMIMVSGRRKYKSHVDWTFQRDFHFNRSRTRRSSRTVLSGKQTGSVAVKATTNISQ